MFKKIRALIDELIVYRELLFILTWKDIKVRYKQTIMGFAWSLFVPCIILISGILVTKGISIFSGKKAASSSYYSIMVKSLPWAFFVSAVRNATHSLTGNHNLITKIYFPREVFPISSILTSFFDFIISSTIFSIILIFSLRVNIFILWLPFIILNLLLFTIGLSFYLSAMNLFYRDVKYIVDVMLNFGIFFTPVLYDSSIFGAYSFYILLNPLASMLENINNIVVKMSPPDYYMLSYSFCFSIFLLVASWLYFHKSETVFAERI